MGMKANLRDRARSPVTGVFPLFVLAATLSGCVPAPSPAPAPPRQTTVAPRPRPAPAPTPAIAPLSNDWRDATITPGTWTYGPGPFASFGNGLLTLQCDAGRQAIVLTAAGGTANGQVSVTLTTATTVRSLPAFASPTGLVVTIPARDPVLDAMAFSRGRFAVASAGLPTLYVPSWTEVSRVIEDCR